MDRDLELRTLTTECSDWSDVTTTSPRQSSQLTSSVEEFRPIGPYGLSADAARRHWSIGRTPDEIFDGAV
jgi:hypothetical protein